MYRPRKLLIPIILVVGLSGTPAVAWAQAPGASGSVGHLPLAHVATLQARPRDRHRRREAKVRTMVWRAGRWVRGAVARIRALRESLRPRLPPSDSLARGPPRLCAR
jgi:hypothetical protein